MAVLLYGIFAFRYNLLGSHAMNTWEALVSFAQEWVDERNKDYIDSVAEAAPGKARSFSIVNDGLWGSIRLSGLERAIVDSPLFQRLRQIKQLGPATLVYPSAAHSRFDHCIGALHRAATVMDSLVVASKDRPAGSLLAPAEELDAWREAVKIGALLHDAGHVFMSHAGERALREFGVIGKKRGSLRGHLDVAGKELECESGVGLAELLSYAIITSTTVRSICSAFNFKKALGSKSDALLTIAGALLHSRKLVSPEERWISDLLSGPLDVDKQDYVPRDALMAGVGVQLESHRCAEVLRVCDFENANVVNDRAHIPFEDKERRLVITFSGVSVVEDMLLSRMSLFLRVYHHHKVRVAERVIERIYQLASAKGMESYFLADVARPFAVLDWSDPFLVAGEGRRSIRRALEILRDDREKLKKLTSPSPEQKQKKKQSEILISELEVIEKLLASLENRALPVRAFAYGRRFPAADAADPIASAITGSDEAWQALFSALLDRSKRDGLEKEIIETAASIAKLSGNPLDAEEKNLLRAAVFVDMSPIKHVDVSPLYVYSHASDRSLVAYEKLFQPGQWLDALRDSKLICYVYAPRQHATLVNAAAELLFAEKFHAMSQHLRDVYSRCDPKETAALKEALLKKYEASIKAKEKAPLAGLWRILTPPSFVSETVKKGFSHQLRAVFDGRTSLLEEFKSEVSDLYALFEQPKCLQIGILFDIIGSSAFCKALHATYSVSEDDARLVLLMALQRSVMEALNGNGFGTIPLKTEGDAALCLSLCVPGDVHAYAEAVRNLIFGEEWQSALAAVCKERGWGIEPSVLPKLRAAASKDDVHWKEQLIDLLGEGATALFVLEPEIKKIVAKEPSIAWLGSWDDLGSIAKTLAHDKLKNPWPLRVEFKKAK